MKITANGALPSAAELVRSYAAQSQSAVKAPKGGLTRRFDQVMISGGPSRESAFEQELKSRLTREVRTATSSDRVAELREQVRSGAYRPDPFEIARKMLLLGEAG